MRRVGSRMFSVRAVVAIAVLAAAVSTARALINPNFTPIQLVEQSKTILIVKLSPGEKDKPMLLKVEVTEALKPKENAPKGPLTIDLSAGPHKAQGEALLKRVQERPNEPALLFAGDFKEEGQGGGSDLPQGFLHFAGKWFSLEKAQAGPGFDMFMDDSHMEGTWAGSTDMLIRAIRYVMSDPEPTMPATAEAVWDSQKQIAKIAGKVSAAVPVELDGAIRQTLFVASDAGDKLFQLDEKDKEKGLADVTDKHKLASKSVVSVWGDFNHDGKLDLASWDGKALTIHFQQPDGTFQAKPADAGDALKGGVLGLAVCDSGKGGQAALLVSTPSWPVLLAPADGGWKATVIGGGSAAAPLPAGKDAGKVGACLLADLDGDGAADVLQLFANAGLFYKGKGAGQFDKPAACQIGLGDGQAKAFLGDYDGDGLLDVCTVAEDRPRLWHNLGGLKFVEMIGYSGEIAYISKPGAIDGMTGDVNNDGRQDVLMVYGTAMPQPPQVFFNRGFRSFGHAHDLALEEHGMLPEAANGQQAGCLGDFNGDGAQDMVLVLANGETWVFYRRVPEGDTALGVRVALPLDGPFAGPLTVVGYTEKRCLGAWNVVAGSQVAFLGQRNAGPCTVKYQFPGGKPQTVEVTLVDKPLRIEIGPDGLVKPAGAKGK